MKTIRRLVYPLIGNTRWHRGTRDNEFVWERYDHETDTWEIKGMSPEEQEDAYLWWAIK